MARLFKDRIIKEKLENYEIPQLEEKVGIVQSWLDAYQSGLLQNKTETQCEQSFNQDFFVNILDYTPFPNEVYTIDPKARTESGGQKPDATLGYFGSDTKRTVAVVEIKDVNTPLDKPQRREGNMSPIQQGFKYKPQYKECDFVIATNFYEIRLFKDNQLDFERFTLKDLVDPKDDFYTFRKFYYLLNVYNFVSKKGQTTTASLLSAIRIEQEEITKGFYKEYKKLRYDLIKNIVANNEAAQKRDNFYRLAVTKAQKIVDRIVLIHFFEDLGLLPDNKLREVVEYSEKGDLEIPVWDVIKNFFKAIDSGNDKLGVPHGYNGELFKQDAEIQQLVISDDICKKFIELGRFDFSEDLTVNILGHIFEQSISDLERLKSYAETGEFEEKESKRKKDGIFYTPEYIVDYIVKNSLGTYLEENERRILDEHGLKEDILDKTYDKRALPAYKKYQEFLRNVKVLDPACGSGAFLVKVFDYLFEENKRVSDILAELEGSSSLFSSENYIKSLLENNIYGVDLNEESVEITKLSLWLKTARKGEKLVNLQGNIKCGNSLISDPEVAGDKAFDWNTEFPEIMRSGGFDVIVGNPPYLRIQGLQDAYPKLVEYYNNNFQSATGNYDIYVLFIEQAHKLLNHKGLASMILPHKFLISEFGHGIRKYLAENKAVRSLLHFEENLVFEVTTYTCVINLSKASKDSLKFAFANPLEVAELNTTNWEYVLYKRLTEDKWQLLSDKQLELFDKLHAMPETVESVFAKVFVGLQTSADKIYLVNGERVGNYVKGYSKSLDREVEIEMGLMKPMLKGQDVSQYADLQNQYYVIFPYLITDGKAEAMTEEYIAQNFPKGYQYLKDNEEELRARERGRMDKEGWYLYIYPKSLTEFDQPKIITPEISLGTNMTYDPGVMYHSTTCYSFILNEPSEDRYKFYLAILNSDLMWYYLKNTGTILRGGYFRFKTKYLYPFPLPKLPEDIQPFVDEVDIMLGLHEKFESRRKKFLRIIQANYQIKKLSKKLESFHDLDYKAFITEMLKKNSSISILEQDDLEELFTSYKTELSNYQTQIDQTRFALNQMVYELYKLTNQEIDLIQN